MEEDVSQLPEAVHVALKHAVHTKKRQRLLMGMNLESSMVQGGMALNKCEDPFVCTASEKCQQECYVLADVAVQLGLLGGSLALS